MVVHNSIFLQIDFTENLRICKGSNKKFLSFKCRTVKKIGQDFGIVLKFKRIDLCILENSEQKQRRTHRRSRGLYRSYECCYSRMLRLIRLPQSITAAPLGGQLFVYPKTMHWTHGFTILRIAYYYMSYSV